MGFQLWYSSNFKIARKGTTFNELQNIFIDKITTKLIYEPLACCKTSDNIFEVGLILENRDFDSIGVINEEGKKVGYILKSELNGHTIENCTNPFNSEILISDSTPISDLLEILSNKEFVYVLDRNEIEGIVTRADINKPIVRIYLFGMLSLFELHLNYWITKIYHDENWKELLSTPRVENAIKIFKDRQGKNDQLTLLECLQISDKKTILIKTESFLKTYEFSKTKFKDLLEKTESIRNELVHSQNSIISNLDWKDFTYCIESIKLFLEKSEEQVRK